MFNSLILVGNLTKKVELRETTGDNKTSVARGTIAVNKKRAGKEEVLFLDFAVFGKVAENLYNYTDKGSKILLDGELKQNNYTKDDGKTVYSYNMFVKSVQFLDSKKSTPEVEEY